MSLGATARLRELGQSLWLDNITRELLDSGRLQRYISESAVTGLTSNPTIFDAAIAAGSDYDETIGDPANAGLSNEALFQQLALADLRRAADLFRPTHEASAGSDGWVSMEIPPLLAPDATGSLDAALALHGQAERRNMFVKIPGTPEGLTAIEEAITAGVPVNVTLLFSRDQYLAAASAYMRGVQRRLDLGLDPCVASVASLFVSRWDTAVAARVPDEMRNRLGIAVARRAHLAHLELLASPPWQRLEAAGILPQRLLWASTGSKDPQASALIYVNALVASGTITTVPEAALAALTQSSGGMAPMPLDGEAAAQTVTQFQRAGVDIDALAMQLQREGVEAFVASWRRLMERVSAKRHA